MASKLDCAALQHICRFMDSAVPKLAACVVGSGFCWSSVFLKHERLPDGRGQRGKTLEEGLGRKKRVINGFKERML